jgi:hypothetical protein
MHQVILIALMLLALVCLVVNGKPKNAIARNVNDKQFSVREFVDLVDRLVAKRSGCVTTCTSHGGKKYPCSIFGLGSDSDTDGTPGCQANSYTYCGCPPNAQFGNCLHPGPSATVIVTKTRGEAYPFDDHAVAGGDVEFQRREDFDETCENIQLVGSGLTISAQCQDKNEVYQPTTLDISTLVVNQNGQLKTSCSRRRRRRALDLWSSPLAGDEDLELQRRDDGTILHSCGGIRLFPHNMHLVASCLDKNRCWNPTKLDLTDYISNDNGKLSIDCTTERRRRAVVQP